MRTRNGWRQLVLVAIWLMPGVHSTGQIAPQPGEAAAASLLTGRTPHDVGVGLVTNLATGYPGYTSSIPKSAATVAQLLRASGWSTAMFGKARRHEGRFAMDPPSIPAWEEVPIAPIGPPLVWGGAALWLWAREEARTAAPSPRLRTARCAVWNMIDSLKDAKGRNQSSGSPGRARRVNVTGCTSRSVLRMLVPAHARATQGSGMLGA